MPRARVRRLVVGPIDTFPVPITFFLILGPAAMIHAVLVRMRALAVAHVIQPFAFVRSSRRIFLRTPPAPHVVDVFSDVVISIREPHVAVPISVSGAPTALIDASISIVHVSKTMPQVVLPEALIFTTISIVADALAVPSVFPEIAHINIAVREPICTIITPIIPIFSFKSRPVLVPRDALPVPQVLLPASLIVALAKRVAAGALPRAFAMSLVVLPVPVIRAAAIN